MMFSDAYNPLYLAGIRKNLNPAKLRTYTGGDTSWWVMIEYELHDYPAPPLVVFCNHDKSRVKNKEHAMVKLLEMIDDLRT